MSFVDRSASLLATCGGDTVKLFDVSVDSGDPCALSYSPTPGSQVNCVKWNHTNLVVASAGDDKKISLWRKNGESMGSVPFSGNENGDDLEESVVTISFSNKSSRYLCSGGSGRIVRIWDLQRKRCIKWLTGHTDAITGVMYNCKDEHLASISMKGDLILHNLASGARAAELKDPLGQVLRVLDYSRLSRHILVTAGDGGSVHLWDTTGRVPKVSWLKQHSAPISGVCFSPSSDKIIASVGLDKKLYTFDSGSRKPTSCIPYEAPFSSLAYSDDSNILAAGTNSGRVVFYDVRGKPQPFTVLRAYVSSEAVTSLCWQRSKPVIVSENNCTAEAALLGGINEDSVLMPDPLPSIAVSNFTSAAALSSSHSSINRSTSGSVSSASYSPMLPEETPAKSRLWKGGSLSRLHAPHSGYDTKDDMDVFSPLVDVQPITPSLSNWWDENDAKKDNALLDKKSSILAASSRRFPFTEGNSDSHPTSDWLSDTTSKQDDDLASETSATPVAPLKSDSSLSPTPPEAWGGNALPDKLTHRQQPTSMFSRGSVSLPFDSTFAGLHDTSSAISRSTINSLTSTRSKSTNLQSRVTFASESSTFSESSSVYSSSSFSTSLGSKVMASSANTELPGLIQSTLPRRYSTYAERISTTSTFGDGIGSAMGSPKSKKSGLETREALLNNLQLRQDSSTSMGFGSLPAINGQASQLPQTLGQPVDQQQGFSSFSLQLVQRTLEETLGSVQKSIHEDVRNLHIELLRQFHLQETEMTSLLNSVLEKQDELMKEVQNLRRENQQLRQLL
ncbi:uncharacterized protein A4U43_C08F36080 [Asparagus officinalis]|uniref:protein NEDD1 n=1 Tax=Asparagus officinalis TaxID=4686 RepID=UPI00098E3AA4|nr:protein NEDD1 [Asparagus officinalis]ONK62031.1 uncharacterized protein A4U43_C08F36080 [Asparagus officinalis]